MALEVTSSRWRSLLVMTKTMEEELKVTFFFGLTLSLHAPDDTTMGRIGCWVDVKGRSLKPGCSHDVLEQISWSRQRRNCKRENRDYFVCPRTRRHAETVQHLHSHSH